MLVLWLKAASRQASDGHRASLAVCLPLFVFNLSSYYLAVLAGAAPRLVSPARMALAMLILVVIPQGMAGLTADLPGPAYYAGVSLLFVAAAAVWLADELRSAPRLPPENRRS